MAAELGSDFCLPLDVGDDAQIDAFFAGLAARWDGFDILVHSVAFAPADQLEGRYLDAVSREGFRIAHDVSSYSLAALAKKVRAVDARPRRRVADAELPGRRARAAELQRHGARQGEPRGQRALPGRRSRRAAASASTRSRPGPIRTLAASGVKGIRADARARRQRRRRSSATSRSRTSATPPPSSARISRPASRGKSSTSTPASTSSACPSPTADSPASPADPDLGASGALEDRRVQDLVGDSDASPTRERCRRSP